MTFFEMRDTDTNHKVHRVKCEGLALTGSRAVSFSRAGKDFLYVATCDNWEVRIHIYFREGFTDWRILTYVPMSGEVAEFFDAVSERCQRQSDENFQKSRKEALTVFLG